MKKTLTIITAIFITLFSIKAQAQDDDIDNQARGYFGFIGGLSAPIGAYGSTNYYNNSSGYAKASGMGGFDMAFYLHKNLGIGITFTYQDQGELNSNDVLNLANGYNNSFFKDETTIAAVDRYENLNLLAGPQYSFVHKKFTLDLRADAGVMKSISTPSLIIVFDYSSNAGQSYYQLSSGSLAFAYGASAGLRYAFSDSWDVGFKINYVNTNGLKIENSGDAGQTGRYQTSLPVNVVQASLGIMVKF
jgi:opacity protein-like surface antigen